MVSHDPEAIARKVLHAMQSDGQRTRPVTFGAIDTDRLFLPPTYTQLYYSPLWPDLERRHQLRYTQLYALRTNEVIMLFERYLVQAILPPIARRLESMQLPMLHRLLLEMLREEKEHDAAFVALNRASRPDLYRTTDFCFFPPSAEMRGFIALMGRSARWLAYPLWLLFFIEESSLTMARDLAAMDENQALGVAELNWLAVHREHTRDERRHTLIDRLLFENCYAKRGKFARRLDGWLFEHTLKAMLFPRASGAGVRVVEQLIRDYPELAGLRPAMVREIVNLGRNPDFLASLLSQRMAPRAWKLFHRCPELDMLANWIPNYV
ncbi:MAG: diiron oxygenase [Pseudomonadota bacterium]